MSLSETRQGNSGPRLTAPHPASGTRSGLRRWGKQEVSGESGDMKSARLCGLGKSHLADPPFPHLHVEEKPTSAFTRGLLGRSAWEDAGQVQAGLRDLHRVYSSHPRKGVEVAAPAAAVTPGCCHGPMSLSATRLSTGLPVSHCRGLAILQHGLAMPKERQRERVGIWASKQNLSQSLSHFHQHLRAAPGHGAAPGSTGGL